MNEPAVEINKESEKRWIITAVISFILMIIFMMIGISNSKIKESDPEFFIKAQAVQATCVDMESYTLQGNGETHCNIYVNYEIKSTKYEYIKISDVPSEYDNTPVGSQITIYCSYTDPTLCRLKKTKPEISAISVIFFILAFLGLAIGIVALRKVFRQRMLVKIAENSKVPEGSTGLYDGLNGGEDTNADNGLNDLSIDYNSQYGNNPMDAPVDPNAVYGYGGGNPMDAPVDPNAVYGYGGRNPMDAPVDPNAVYGYGGGNPMDAPVDPNNIYGYQSEYDSYSQ